MDLRWERYVRWLVRGWSPACPSAVRILYSRLLAARRVPSLAPPRSFPARFCGGGRPLLTHGDTSDSFCVRTVPYALLAARNQSKGKKEKKKKNHDDACPCCLVSVYSYVRLGRVESCPSPRLARRTSASLPPLPTSNTPFFFFFAPATHADGGACVSSPSHSLTGAKRQTVARDRSPAPVASLSSLLGVHSTSPWRGPPVSYHPLPCCPLAQAGTKNGVRARTIRVVEWSGRLRGARVEVGAHQQGGSLRVSLTGSGRGTASEHARRW